MCKDPKGLRDPWGLYARENQCYPYSAPRATRSASAASTAN